MRLMQGLPSLRQLQMKGETQNRFEDQSTTSYIHSSLEALMAEKDHVLSPYARVTFPSLRFLAINCYGVYSKPGVLDEIFHAAASPGGLMLSICGKPPRHFLQRMVKNIPPNSRLHLAPSAIISNQEAPGITIESDNLEEIFCSVQTGSLSWLAVGPARKFSTRTLAVHIPANAANVSAIRSRRDELERAGYRLEMHAQEEIETTLLSVAPELRVVLQWDS
ncbi:hypothetical protein BKA70DRAFT_1238350 [Coprinopsis sp. MPI-PUGE-AT-0042]|nr:hypothetical protein BKA70DRAFT_1238350 [Coprinopsis sp. MPI-PUGE-AT-0042]